MNPQQKRKVILNCSLQKWKFFFPLVLCFLANKAYAEGLAPMMSSPYYQGRANTGIAIADNEEAIFYNPAGIAKSKRLFNRVVLPSAHLELSKGITNTAKKMLGQNAKINEALKSSQGIPHHIGTSTFLGVLLKKVALGFFVTGGTDLLLYKDSEQGALEALRIAATFDGGTSLTLASNIKKRNYLVGMTVKYFYRFQSKLKANAAEAQDIEKIKNNKQLSMVGSAFSFDLGLMYHSLTKRGYSWGLTIENVGNTSFTSTSTGSKALDKKSTPLQPIEQTINFGFAYERVSGINRFRLLSDFRDLLNKYSNEWPKRLSFGLELTLNKIFGLTSGLRQGYPCGGLYFDFRYARLDFGSYTEEVGKEAGARPDQRFFIKLEFNI